MNFIIFSFQVFLGTSLSISYKYVAGILFAINQSVFFCFLLILSERCWISVNVVQVEFVLLPSDVFLFYLFNPYRSLMISSL